MVTWCTLPVTGLRRVTVSPNEGVPVMGCATCSKNLGLTMIRFGLACTAAYVAASSGYAEAREPNKGAPCPSTTSFDAAISVVPTDGSLGRPETPTVSVETRVTCATPGRALIADAGMGSARSDATRILAPDAI